MGPGELFQPTQVPLQSYIEEDIPNQTFQEEYDIQVKKILEEGIPTSPRYYFQCYVTTEDE